MGLLTSDITLIDPTVSEAMRLLDELSELGYEYDAARCLRRRRGRPYRVMSGR